MKSGQIDILIHGEHSLFCVTEQGNIGFQKRLDYDVAASTTYNRDGGTSVQSVSRTKTGRTNANEGQRQHLLVATHTGRLLVYGNTSLLWAAKLGYPPVAVAVATFGGIQGLVVCLDEQGRLAITYMGTVPPSVAATNMDITKTDEMDFEAMEKEHKQLLDDIRASQNSTESIGKYSKRRRSNIAVISVRIVFMSWFLFQCVLCNHTFSTNPNNVYTNIFFFMNFFHLFFFFILLPFHFAFYVLTLIFMIIIINNYIIIIYKQHQRNIY